MMKEEDKIYKQFIEICHIVKNKFDTNKYYYVKFVIDNNEDNYLFLFKNYVIYYDDNNIARNKYQLMDNEFISSDKNYKTLEKLFFESTNLSWVIQLPDDENKNIIGNIKCETKIDDQNGEHNTIITMLNELINDYKAFKTPKTKGGNIDYFTILNKYL